MRLDLGLRTLFTEVSYKDRYNFAFLRHALNHDLINRNP